jgi:5-methylcytosine-specific restriction protein A
VKREHVLRESPFCGWCARLGLQTYAVEVDHVIPVVEGGTDDLINLQGLCLAHHREKGGRDRARFWRRIREAGA